MFRNAVRIEMYSIDFLFWRVRDKVSCAWVTLKKCMRMNAQCAQFIMVLIVFAGIEWSTRMDARERARGCLQHATDTPIVEM